MKARTWLVTGALVGATAFAWHVHGKSADTARITDGGDLDSLLTDRPWIDHLPRGERDAFNVFIVISQQPVGVFQKATAWQGAYEVFTYEAQGRRKLTVAFPHTGDHDDVRAEVTECHEHGMDYCLELSGASRGVKRYYSRADWGAHSLRDAEQLVDTIAHDAR
jgi:hypothetical protein